MGADSGLVTLTAHPPVHQDLLEKERISSLPILLLNVHEHCNCRCLMCDIWKRKNGRELNLAGLTRHRESLQRLGVRQVVLTGGEPLLHGNLQALCDFLRNCGVRVTLLTTGLLLAKRADEIAAGVDEVIISIDGPEAIHDRIRRVKGAYRLVHDGIRQVRDRNRRISFHGRSTVQKANHGFLRQTVSGAKQLPLDSISFLAVDVRSPAFNREVAWTDERQTQVALSSEEVARLDTEIDALALENAEDFRSGYIVESPEKLRRIARRFREQLGELAPVAPQCNAPWISAVVEVDGSIRPCFFHRAVGNMVTNSLEDAINGEDALRFRASLDVPNNPTCQRCVCSLNYKPDSQAPEFQTRWQPS